MSRLSCVWMVCVVGLWLGLLGCPGGPPVLSEGGGEGVAGDERVGDASKRPEDGGEVPELPVPEPRPTRSQIPARGIVLSSPRGGQIWATDDMKQMMAEVQEHGSNWVTYHPYGRIANDGSITFSTSLDQESVLAPMRFGKELGMKVFLTPHIAYWGSKFSWRGEIKFENEAAWQRFFQDYKAWTVTLAKMAEKGKADLFSVGIEYKETLHREKDWRDVIKAVREVYKGKIVYAANWDSYTRVPFWDAVDYIGIQAYFPVATQADPPESELRAGWQSVLTKLDAFSKQHGKQIIFTELGYNLSTWAGVRPWDYEQGGENADAVKLRCMKVALEAIKAPPFLHGVFLWKWFPDGRVSDRDFLLQYPAMKSLLKAAWTSPE